MENNLNVDTWRHRDKETWRHGNMEAYGDVDRELWTGRLGHGHGHEYGH